MKNNPKISIGVVFFNEAGKIEVLLNRFKDLKIRFSYKVLFINDGSTDNSVDIVKDYLNRNQPKNIEIISNKMNRGVGFTIRRIIHYGLKNKFDICVIMAGNGKDNPVEIPLLLSPIMQNNYDYVQGSRFLRGGSFKNLPFFRKFFIRSFTYIVSLFTGFKCSDSTNGFRAYKLSIFKDKRINIDQNWLDRYEFETYLHVKVITLGYLIKEVGVSKNYLQNVKNYSKIRPFIDWWKLARPLFLLKFGFRN